MPRLDARASKSARPICSGWLGQEYWRLRGDGVEVSRSESYGVLQEALRNRAQWVDQGDGIEVWLRENHWGMRDT